MARRRRMSILFIILLFIVAVLVVYQFVFVKRFQYTYEVTGEAFKNPLMGYAPNADYVEAVGDNTLVYVDVTWRELEPEEGVFAFADIEESNFLAEWKEQGKNVVFRFVCDVPDEEEHMDIPDWLYEKTGDGTFYDCSYGKGYSPNYRNKTFIEYHAKAIAALGEYFGQDTFFSYVELGSLGHWGEWHVNYSAGIRRFPSEEICAQYVQPYIEAFPNAKLLMRRPFSFVEKYGLGVFNDMTGEPDATAEWLDWIYNGGVYDSASKPIELVACEDVWNKAPIGGEFTSSISMEEMLVTEQARTIELLQDSHMTFLGPKCPIANREEQELPEATAEILKNIGYRYGVTSAKITWDKNFGSATVEIQLKNHGVAPIYFSWPVCVYLLEEDGKVISRYETKVDLTKVTSGQTTMIKIKLQEEILKEKLPYVAIGIENPQDGEMAVFLDMKTENLDKKYLLNPVKND